MRINKEEGITLLEMHRLPTIQKINIEELPNSGRDIVEGLSVRLSPRGNDGHNVYLPSIHNYKDLDKIREFIEKYSNEYNIIIHKTVKPELIGSASRLNGFLGNSIVMETFRNFEERKKDIIHNRMTLPVFRE